ncbi:hypothetical protein V6N11_016370 [Hibiscus sabdariffa]|uniref:Uncharacterized protein n=1 Tax=Hibiscus sabdariffa TaxID=183260 RepID=A0ABR2TUS5_9ROSI
MPTNLEASMDRHGRHQAPPTLSVAGLLLIVNISLLHSFSFSVEKNSLSTPLKSSREAKRFCLNEAN